MRTEEGTGRANSAGKNAYYCLQFVPAGSTGRSLGKCSQGQLQAQAPGTQVCPFTGSALGRGSRPPTALGVLWYRRTPPGWDPGRRIESVSIKERKPAAGDWK